MKRILQILFMIVIVLTQSGLANEKDLRHRNFITLLEFFEITQDDITIEIDQWYEAASFTPKEDVGAEEVQAVRQILEDYVVITKDEQERIMVSLLGTGSMQVRLILKDGRVMKLSGANFLKVEYLKQGIFRPKGELILSPRAWVECCMDLQ